MEHYAVIKNDVLELYLLLLEIAQHVQHTVKRFKRKKMKESHFHDSRDLQGSQEMESWEIINSRWSHKLPESMVGVTGVSRGRARYTHYHASCSFTFYF